MDNDKEARKYYQLGFEKGLERAAEICREIAHNYDEYAKAVTLPLVRLGYEDARDAALECERGMYRALTTEVTHG